MSTVSALVLLFSYHTSTNSEGAIAGTASLAEPLVTVSPSTTSDTTEDLSVEASPTTSAGGSTSSGRTSSTAGQDSRTSSPASPSAEATSTTTAAAGTSGTYTGSSVTTRWGPVQVQITVDDAGNITSAEAIVYPTGNHRDVEINSFAVPRLNAQVLSAQSADIDAVSGATVTSQGYIRSLQSAIDQANL
jgi:uncharacterized protein with FMN-binding domain